MKELEMEMATYPPARGGARKAPAKKIPAPKGITGAGAVSGQKTLQGFFAVPEPRPARQMRKRPRCGTDSETGEETEAGEASTEADMECERGAPLGGLCLDAAPLPVSYAAVVVGTTGVLAPPPSHYPSHTHHGTRPTQPTKEIGRGWGDESDEGSDQGDWGQGERVPAQVKGKGRATYLAKTPSLASHHSHSAGQTSRAASKPAAGPSCLQHRAELPAFATRDSDPLDAARGQAGEGQPEGPLTTMGASLAASATAPRPGSHDLRGPLAIRGRSAGVLNSRAMPAPSFPELAGLLAELARSRAETAAVHETLARLMEEVASLRKEFREGQVANSQQPATLGLQRHTNLGTGDRGVGPACDNPALATKSTAQGDRAGVRPMADKTASVGSGLRSVDDNRGRGVGGRLVPGLDAREGRPADAPANTPAEVDTGEQRQNPAPVEGEWQKVHRGGRSDRTRPIGPRPSARDLQKRHTESTKAVEQALAPRALPALFTMLYMEVPDPRRILKAVGRERELTVTNVLRELGIAKLVSGASIMPGGRIQLVCRMGAAESVRQALVDTTATLHTDTDPFAPPRHSPRQPEADMQLTARRLALLCRLSKARNYHQTILEGASPDMRAAILASYRKITGSPRALLGHEGRWYSTHQAPAQGNWQGDAQMGEGAQL